MAFVTLINELCPSSADSSAAIRCVRLARNAYNEYLCEVIRHLQGRTSPHPVSLEHWKQVAWEKLTEARWQASAAIACGGK
jgi:hypothetical protein